MSKDGFIESIRGNYDKIPLKIKNRTILYLYDFIVYISRNYPHKFSNALIAKVSKRFGLRGKRILDAGSYTGYNSFYFHCERNRVVGVELSNKVAEARKRYRFYDIEFVHGDINEELLKFGDNKFDFIFSSNLPVHYDTGSVLTSVHFNTFIQRAVKCLNPGGVLYYIFYSSKHAKVAIPVNEAELREFCGRSGLKNWSIKNSYLLNNNTVELIITNSG